MPESWAGSFSGEKRKMKRWTIGTGLAALALLSYGSTGASALPCQYRNNRPARLR